MKFIAGLLAFYVLYMSMQPEVDAILSLASVTECCSSDHCSPPAEHRDAATGEEDGCCGNGICNPFLCCCTSMSAAQMFSSFRLFALASGIEKIGSYESPLHSQFAPDFWQPPKIG